MKPTALIGLSGAGPIFTPEVLTAMGEINERPIIFPMSNPTHKLEANAQDTQKYTGGRAIFASGSPQQDVVMGESFLLILILLLLKKEEKWNKKNYAEESCIVTSL